MRSNDQVKIIDLFKDKRWDEFVNNHPQGTMFHLSNWARVLQKTYGYIPYYFILENFNGEIEAGCPFFLIKSWFTGNRLVCLPFTDGCFPLVTSDEDITVLFSAALETAKKERASYIEVRGEYPKHCSQGLNLESHNYYKNFIIELSSDLISISKKFSRRFRRYVYNVAMPNLQVKIAENEEEIKIFYKLNMLTRKKHGVLPQPYTFFQNVWQEIISEGLGFVLLAYFQNTPIAGGVFFTYRDTMYHKFTASDNKYSEYRANHLLVWSAIQYGCDEGFRYYDFGRTSPDNTGLMFFKKCWGAKEINLPYHYWPSVKGVTSTEQKSLKYRMLTSILRRTPIAVSRAAGELLYKQLG